MRPVGPIPRGLVATEGPSPQMDTQPAPDPREQRPVEHYFATIRDVEEALERRLIIGQAQGILMERLGLTPERAFAYLNRASQQTNTKLEKVAEQLVETRLLPRVN